MTDRELLESAAKAAGIRGEWCSLGCILRTDLPRGPDGGCEAWKPLEDDGDALRLAVKLNMTCRFYFGNSVAQSTTPGGPSIYEEVTNTAAPMAGARLAIVRAAAEIGKAMP